MSVLIVSVLAALSVLALAGAAVLFLVADRGFELRLSALARGEGEARDRAALKLEQAFRRIAERVSQGAFTEAERGTLKLSLLQAGFNSERRVEYFFAARVACALMGGVAGVLAALATKPDGTLQALSTVLAGATLGLYLPPVWLKRRIKGRVEQVRLAMPDAMDLMVVCVEAGATLNAAMQKVEQELRALHTVLADQFRTTLLEMQAGAGRADSLRRLAERAPADELRAMVSLLIQSESLGASVGQTLRVFAEEMRSARFLRAEQKAAELPVKIAFPLVLFIFPCLMGVIFTPVVIRFIRVLMNVQIG